MWADRDMNIIAYIDIEFIELSTGYIVINNDRIRKLGLLAFFEYCKHQSMEHIFDYCEKNPHYNDYLTSRFIMKHLVERDADEIVEVYNKNLYNKNILKQYFNKYDLWIECLKHHYKDKISYNEIITDKSGKNSYRKMFFILTKSSFFKLKYNFENHKCTIIELEKKEYFKKQYIRRHYTDIWYDTKKATICFPNVFHSTDFKLNNIDLDKASNCEYALIKSFLTINMFLTNSFKMIMCGSKDFVVQYAINQYYSQYFKHYGNELQFKYFLLNNRVKYRSPMSKMSLFIVKLK